MVSVALLATVVSVAVVSQTVTPHDLNVTFVNEHPTEIFQVLWMGPGDPNHVGNIEPAGGVLHIIALEGYSYLIRSPSTFDRHVKTSVECSGATPQHWCAGHAGHTFFLVGVPENGVRVDCRLKGRAEEVIHIEVRPDWAPSGAARFLQLVRERFFDGMAITHAIPQHLAHFGIGTTQEARQRWESATIPDDTQSFTSFEPGMLSFAGTGQNSRTTEMFFVMPGARHDAVCVNKDASCADWEKSGECTRNPGYMQQNCALSCGFCKATGADFGGKPWETPFAIVSDSSSLAAIGRLRSYGDIPPSGSGPDPSRIKAEGYEYLDRHFSNLDRFDSCERADLAVL